MSKYKEIEQENKKFTILEMLDNMTVSDKRKARKDLVKLMEISTSTFERILYAKLNDRQEISATNLIRVAEYFKKDPAELINIDEEAHLRVSKKT